MNRETEQRIADNDQALKADIEELDRKFRLLAEAEAQLDEAVSQSMQNLVESAGQMSATSTMASLASSTDSSSKKKYKSKKVYIFK